MLGLNLIHVSKSAPLEDTDEMHSTKLQYMSKSMHEISMEADQC